ncbi:hypothetical protein [uncultured Helicobacter sp.]
MPLPNRVPDALTPSDVFDSKNLLYARVAERRADSFRTSDTQVLS